MTAELFSKLTDAIAEDVAAKAGEKLLAFLDAQRMKEPDPLMTCKQAAAHLGVSDNTIRRLVEAGEIKRAPALTEIRMRRSEVDKYGVSQ